jgi:hypothetical protein
VLGSGPDETVLSLRAAGAAPPPVAALLAAEAALAACDDSAAAVSAVVFWHTTCANVHRYVAEHHSVAAVVALHSDLGLLHYSKAHGLVLARLHAASAEALGVALNFSVFLFDVRRCRAEAADLARGALDAAAAAAAVPLPDTDRAAGAAVARLIGANLSRWHSVLQGAAAL